MNSKLTTFLKFRHFALIEAIADQGTMHRAATALHMTQSTASKMLADLETILGAALFDRAPRGMTPTPLGRYALAVARTQTSNIARFEEDFIARRDGGYGTLSIGAIMGSAPDVVAHAVADMKRIKPQLTIRLLGETSDQILDMLEAGKIDLAVGRFNSTRHEQLFSFEHLAEEPLVLIARQEHALVSGFDGNLHTLLEHPWVLQPPATPTRQVLDQMFADVGSLGPVNCVECVSILAILHLVQVSDAVAVLPVSVVRAHLQAGLLVQLPMFPAAYIVGFGLVIPKTEALSKTASTFANFLRNRAE
jgi:DNA-binding transcriptional LysR family regulator